MSPSLHFVKKAPVWAAGVLAMATVARLTAQPAPPAAVIPAGAEQPIIELPKFEVTDSRVLPAPEKWRYASIPGFEVLSSISVRATTRFVKDFFLLQAAINEIMPGFRRSDVAVPSSLILAGGGKGFDRFLPTQREEERYRTNSLFFDDPERGAIVVDFALGELQLEDNTTEEADPYRGFYKEYFRYLIRKQTSGKPPPWFEEGLVQLFASIDVTKKWINFAQVGDGFGGPRTGDFNRLLSQRALMSFLSCSPIRRCRPARFGRRSRMRLSICASMAAGRNTKKDSSRFSRGPAARRPTKRFSRSASAGITNR